MLIEVSAGTHRSFMVVPDDRGMSPRTRPADAPAFVTFLLAPVVGELLSSSAPLPGFLVVWLPLALLYGCGVLIVRELAVRWGSGWWGIALLGAAYGIVEEGLVTRAFFDPAWEDLGALATFGRDGGINWLWALQLTVFHAAISVGATLLFVRILFPHRWEEPWLSRRGMGWCFVGIAAWLAAGFAAYRPGAEPLVLTVAVVALFVAAARFVPSPRRRRGPAPRPRRVFATAFTAAAVVMLGPYLLAEVPAAHPLLAAALIVGVVAAMVGRGSRWPGEGWGDRHRLALASGELGFFLVIAPIVSGSPWIAVTSLAAGLVLHHRARRLRIREAGIGVEEVTG